MVRFRCSSQRRTGCRSGPSALLLLLLLLLLSLENDSATGHAFAVAGKDQPATSEQIVPHLSEKLGVPDVEANLPGIPTFYAVDSSSTEQILGYRPEHDVLQMIDEALTQRA